MIRFQNVFCYLYSLFKVNIILEHVLRIRTTIRTQRWVYKSKRKFEFNSVMYMNLNDTKRFFDDFQTCCGNIHFTRWCMWHVSHASV